MSSSYELIYHAEVVKHDIPRLSSETAQRIKKTLESKLSTHPEIYGKPLRHTLKGIWSLRAGDYRILYQIQTKKVLILKIGHRRDVYVEP